jgi:hypothetical protein
MEINMSYSELVLPFITDRGGDTARLSSDMEVTALLCLAEAERRKSLGILRGPVEALTVLSKLHHPLWAVPWGDGCLLVDGTRMVSSILQYAKPPDIEAFVEDLKRSSTVQELYRNTVKSHRETFSHFLSTTEILLEGLIMDEELLSDVLSLMKDTQASGTNGAPSLILPRIFWEESVKLRKGVSEHDNLLQSEIKGLHYAIEALSRETEVHVEKMRQELGLIKEKHEAKIAAVRAKVEEKTKLLKEERDGKTETVATGAKREVERVREEKRKWEQELAKLERDKSEFAKRKEIRRRMKDEVGETRWNVRLQEVKNRIATVKGKIKTLSSFVDRSNKETEKTIRSIHEAYRKLMDREAKKLRDLESRRDSELEKKEKEIADLQTDTTAIQDEIKQLAHRKREHADLLKRAAIEWKAETLTLVQLPIYLIQFETDRGKRIRIYPPVVPGTPGGLLAKIRKTLKGYSLQSKMQALLKPRSRAIESMLDNFERRLNQDEDLQRSLSPVSAANNLLASSKFKEQLRTGINKLEAEGWVDPDEREAILRTYATEQDTRANG